MCHSTLGVCMGGVCGCVEGFAVDAALGCVSTSKVYLEEIRVVGTKLWLRMSWDVQCTAVPEDMIAVYKDSRQVPAVFA